MKKLPLNPKAELFRWGPIPGRFFYTSTFCEINYKYFCQKYLGENWPPTLFLFRDKRMVWINEYAKLRSAGRRVFMKYILPVKSRCKIYAEWKERVRALRKLEKKISGLKLRSLTNKEFLDLWQEFHRAYIPFWIPATAPELGNYGADKLLEEKLKKYIKNSAALGEALEVLTAPEKMSFYQEEELDLAKSRDLKAHRKKYFWLQNSYLGTRVLPVDFFAKRRRDLIKNPGREITEKIRQAVLKKEQLRKKYRLNREVMDIARGISEGIAWQDERKKYIFEALHYQDLLLKEAARRKGYDFDGLLNFWFWEITAILKGKDFHRESERRRRGFGVYFYKSYKNLSPSETEEYWRIYGEEKIGPQMSEVKGLVVSRGRGKITGRVRIILSPDKALAFRKGEILVAPMTSPEYVFVMKKAAAIVTDTGGLTSHAAIVSRELGVPCIVGTKIATSVLKDGDMVEVDATKGVVRKIKI